MTGSALAVLRGGPLGVAEELSSWLPGRPRVATERWLAAIHAARFALRPRPVWRLAGAARVDGRPFEVVTDLAGDALGYWSDLFFDGTPTRTALGRRRVRDRLAMGDTADLVMMTHHRVFCGHARRSGWSTIPSWLETGIELSGSVEETFDAHPHGRRSRQSDLRRIRRDALRPVVVRDAAAVREFLRDWYGAYVDARWGETCVHLDAAWMRRAERYCEVLWVMRGAKRLAGLLVEDQGAALRMVVVGMLDAAERQRGALAATYHFAVGEAVRRGSRELRTGGTRPVLSDGVLEFKRKWGAGVRQGRQLTYLSLACREWSPTARALVARHPIVVETADAEFRALTDPSAVPEEARGMFEVGGLAGLLVPAGERGCESAPLTDAIH